MTGHFLSNINFVANIGLSLRELRKKRAETLHHVSKQVDIDSPLLSKIERGVRLPTEEQLKRLAVHFEVLGEELHIQLAAQQILRKYGANLSTYKAVKLVESFLTKLPLKL